MNPDRTISAEYAAWCNASPRVAATIGGIRSWVPIEKNDGPNGTPKDSWLYRIARLYQNSSWRISGTDRNTQMYAQLTIRNNGLRDRRINANTVPSTNPMAIPSTVSSIVSRTASSTERENRYAPNVGQSKALFVT